MIYQDSQLFGKSVYGLVPSENPGVVTAFHPLDSYVNEVFMIVGEQTGRLFGFNAQTLR